MNQAYFSLNTNSFIQIRYMQPRTHATPDTCNPGYMQLRTHATRTHATPDICNQDTYTRTYTTPENYRSSKTIDLPIYPDKMFSLLSLKISDAGKE